MLLALVALLWWAVAGRRHRRSASPPPVVEKQWLQRDVVPTDAHCPRGTPARPLVLPHDTKPRHRPEVFIVRHKGVLSGATMTCHHVDMVLRATHDQARLATSAELEHARAEGLHLNLPSHEVLTDARDEVKRGNKKLIALYGYKPAMRDPRMNTHWYAIDPWSVLANGLVRWSRNDKNLKLNPRVKNTF